MKIIGLTGSIGMGKSTAARTLRRLGLPVHDSDATVHRLMAPRGAALAAIDRAFPGVVGSGGIDRQALGAKVFGNPSALAVLESILHPLVRADTMAFLRRQARRRAIAVVLDVPLLFEARTDVLCDLVIVLSAPAFIQRQRVLARPGMTEAKLAGVLERQMPDRQKRRYADVVVPTGLGLRVALQALRQGLRLAETRPDGRWPPNPYRQRTDARNRPRHRNDRP